MRKLTKEEEDFSPSQWEEIASNLEKEGKWKEAGEAWAHGASVCLGFNRGERYEARAKFCQEKAEGKV